MYAKIQNGSVVEYPYGLGQLQRDNPNTSFVLPVTDEVYAEYGVLPVANAEQPVIDRTKRIFPGTPALVNGVWTQTWAVEDVTADDLLVQTTYQEKTVRQQRNEKLKETDWMVIRAAETSVALAAEWATYRQALRDISAQAGFPWDVQWPKQP